MTYIAKPLAKHPRRRANSLGLVERDYEGTVSTLCAGCGHDSITAALVRSLFELEVPPHRVAKLSGIGCSSKTPAYFLGTAHGFNSVHGRMPSVAMGANAANRDLLYIGVSGDGDSLSIGFGQFAHALRRNLNMAYIIENNGVYGLTKGQFSASADRGSKSKRGEANEWAPIDPVLTAINLGATFVARSFSGDKEQLVPLMKAAIKHPGFALLDVISPCVTFNDHQGSTKSYRHTRDYFHEVVHTDYVPPAREITTDYGDGSTRDVGLHDGSLVRLRKVDEEFDTTDRNKVTAFLTEHQERGEVVTGLLFLDPDSEEYHDTNHTVAQPLRELPFESLCPGAEALRELQDGFR